MLYWLFSFLNTIFKINDIDRIDKSSFEFVQKMEQVLRVLIKCQQRWAQSVTQSYATIIVNNNLIGIYRIIFIYDLTLLPIVIKLIYL